MTTSPIPPPPTTKTQILQSTQKIGSTVCKWTESIIGIQITVSRHLLGNLNTHNILACVGKQKKRSN